MFCLQDKNENLQRYGDAFFEANVSWFACNWSECRCRVTEYAPAKTAHNSPHLTLKTCI